jgi:hypothetical protein
LAAKQGDITADTRADEATIDQLVYQLYDLTPAEIALVDDLLHEGQAGLRDERAQEVRWPLGIGSIAAAAERLAQ